MEHLKGLEMAASGSFSTLGQARQKSLVRVCGFVTNCRLAALELAKFWLLATCFLVDDVDAMMTACL